MDPEIIEDSSPIKNRFGEYRPVDRKANKYFTLDDSYHEDLPLHHSCWDCSFHWFQSQILQMIQSGYPNESRC